MMQRIRENWFEVLYRVAAIATCVYALFHVDDIVRCLRH